MRISFQLRRPVVGYGATRYESATWGAGPASDSPPGELTDYDSALRADGLQVAPEAPLVGSFESSAAQCYGEVNLKWSVPNMVAEDAIGPAPPEITHTLLVYSPNGIPETVNSGTILVESPDRFSFDHTGLPEGKWAYYALFVRYQSSDGDDYYEKVAGLAELAVKNYDSTLMLWERIPGYFRREDATQGDLNYDEYCLGFQTFGEPVGPLLKFLSVIGFEIDKTRTLIDFQMVSRDPQLANGPVLDTLSQELGAVIRNEDLGTSRLRLLMDNIGSFRRAKGTENGSLFFIEAIMGGNASIDTATREITLYSQRVNLMTDPRNKKTPGADLIDWRPADYDEIYPDDVTFADRDPQGGPSIAAIERVSERWKFIDGHTDNTGDVDYGQYPPDPPIVNAETLLVGALYQIQLPITGVVGDTISFSVHSGVGSTNIVWARLVNDTNGAIVASSDKGVNRHGGKYFDLLVPASGTFKMEYLVDLRPGPFEDTKFLIERNNAGPYFDGFTTRGGWLTGVSNVSDFRWSGVPDNSPSLYHEDYERTIQAIDAYLSEVLPIDVADTFTIVDYHAIL